MLFAHTAEKPLPEIGGMEFIMQKYSINKVNGKIINEGTVNEREIKLFVSPDPRALIRREEFGCGITVIQPKQIHEEHFHPDSEEVILVVSGTGTARIGGKEVTVQPMEVIGVDKGEPHMFTNNGDIPLQLYWIYTPPGPEKKFIVENSFGGCDEEVQRR